MVRVVIGMTGTFGSGCTKIAREFIEPLGYKYLSLSDLLRQHCREELRIDGELTRTQLQDHGNNLRERLGPGVLAERAISIVNQDSAEKWVLDSIRNPEEVQTLRREYSGFFLIGVYADRQIRWERSRERYKNDHNAFDEDEKRDREEDLQHGQRVAECFMNSDLVISNNDELHKGNDAYDMMGRKIRRYTRLFEEPFSDSPTEEEAFMAAAYVNGQLSSCLKRKVGAVLVDPYGNIFSSGYNEVPKYHDTCRQRWGKCYRDKAKDDFGNELSKQGVSKEVWKSVEKSFPGQSKHMDLCRSLHAEENAILNVARLGGGSIALNVARLYTTTYPCNLCANKIAQVRISEVIYFEPYPMEEAKAILSKNSVRQKPFEGITFRCYFRVYGGVRQ